MANKHYPVEHEFEVTITVKVKITSISNYHPLSESRITEILDDVKNELTNDIPEKLVGTFYGEDASMCDAINYEISRKDA